MQTWVSITVLFIVAILAIIFGPIFTIWALNTVFNTGIAITFWNWLSVSWLTFVISAAKLNIKN